MKLVESIDEIRQAITHIKENGAEWFTNLYVEDGKLENWIGKQQLFLMTKKKNTTNKRGRPEKKFISQKPQIKREKP